MKINTTELRERYFQAVDNRIDQINSNWKRSEITDDDKAIQLLSHHLKRLREELDGKYADGLVWEQETYYRGKLLGQAALYLLEKYPDLSVDDLIVWFILKYEKF